MHAGGAGWMCLGTSHVARAFNATESMTIYETLTGLLINMQVVATVATVTGNHLHFRYHG